ncbi:MAG: phage integrase SAM-like domain-containing protein [Crocinitomicaceae bacterium]
MGKLKSSFVLKKYKGEEKLVELNLNFGYKEYNSIKDKYYYKPLRYYTGIRVFRKEWDSNSKKPFDAKKHKDLLNIEQTAHDIFNYLSKGEKEITPSLFREELDRAVKGKAEAKSVIGIAEFIRKVILEENSARRSAKTLQSYHKLLMKIEKFEEQRNVIITVDNLDEDLFLEFIEFVRSVVNRINSVWGEQKTFKSVLNEVRRKYKVKVFNPTIELAKTDKVSSKTEDRIYFTFDQIQKVIDYTPKTDSLKNTKLILLTLLFSGCRYSDVFKVIPENGFSEGEVNFSYARFIDQKTGKDIVIPFLKPLTEAISENEGELPYKISDVKFNEYVKELCKLAKLDEEVKLSYTDSYGRTQYESKEFYKFVTSHIGRRSFITNLISFIPITILTKITGHSIRDKSIIFSYNKISVLDNAVLFVKELSRVQKSNPNEFPIKLV